MKNWTEEKIVLISAIEHYSYCPRQCALIHMEKVFDENIFTLKGHLEHENVDRPEGSGGNVLVEYALPIWSEKLGLQGKSDAIEFRPDGSIYPVEYKHGPRKASMHDDLQLCAEAVCLEEMLSKSVEKGAIYHISSRRRREVTFDAHLRAKMTDVVNGIRSMMTEEKLPPAIYDARCKNCSLIEACMPEILSGYSASKARAELFTPIHEGEIL